MGQVAAGRRLGAVGVLLLRCTRLLEREELLRPERLVVDLCRRLDQVLEVGPGGDDSELADWHGGSAEWPGTDLVRKLRR